MRFKKLSERAKGRMGVNNLPTVVTQQIATPAPYLLSGVPLYRDLPVVIITTSDVWFCPVLAIMYNPVCSGGYQIKCIWLFK